MNPQPLVRHRRAIPICLSVAIMGVLLAVAGARPAPAAVDLVWVRQEPPIVNINDDPLYYEPSDPRFEGSFTRYTVNETAITMEERYVDHDYEWYHVTIRSDFDRPPTVLDSPEPVAVRFSHSGTYRGGGAIGARFWYSAQYGSIVDPWAVLAYFPWDPAFDGTSTFTWTLRPPAAYTEGATFGLYGGWWNCAPCNVTWTYRAERADEVEQLGTEVARPRLVYQGEEMAAGEVFFPGTCALPDGRAAADCRHTQTATADALARQVCVIKNLNRIIMILNRTELSELQMELVFYIAYAKVKESCLYNGRVVDDGQLGWVVQQGAMTVSNVVDGQTITVHTPLGAAAADRQGSFLVGYDPGSKKAVFRAYSSPLTIRPVSGAALVLQPPAQVELRPGGFGPVTVLPRVFLPVAVGGR